MQYTLGNISLKKKKPFFKYKDSNQCKNTHFESHYRTNNNIWAFLINEKNDFQNSEHTLKNLKQIPWTALYKKKFTNISCLSDMTWKNHTSRTFIYSLCPVNREFIKYLYVFASYFQKH